VAEDNITFNPPKHPSLPSELQGAIDLEDPVQKCIAGFVGVMAQHRGASVVLIGLTLDGNVALTYHAPNGTIQALGLLAAANAILASGPVTTKDGQR
jgi:hypothetical protein